MMWVVLYFGWLSAMAELSGPANQANSTQNQEPVS